MNRFERYQYKEAVLDWLLNTITDPFYTYVHQLEHQLCMNNETPDGFMFNNMVFKDGSTNLAFTCKPELEEKAKEVWELKLKLKRDWRYLENYFNKVFARLNDIGQLYCYVPQFMHKRLDEALGPNVDEKVLIDGLEPDESMLKLISFYVMSRLII